MVGYMMIFVFLISITIKSVIFGHNWSLACYSCKKCLPSCILGIDPSELLLAANLNAPELYITVCNVNLSANQAIKIDRYMPVTFQDNTYILSDAMSDGIITNSDVITTRKLKAKDAAVFCIKCKACIKACPFSLPIIEVVDELRKKDTE